MAKKGALVSSQPWRTDHSESWGCLRCVAAAQRPDRGSRCGLPSLTTPQANEFIEVMFTLAAGRIMNTLSYCDGCKPFRCLRKSDLLTRLREGCRKLIESTTLYHPGVLSSARLRRRVTQGSHGRAHNPTASLLQITSFAMLSAASHGSACSLFERQTKAVHATSQDADVLSNGDGSCSDSYACIRKQQLERQGCNSAWNPCMRQGQASSRVLEMVRPRTQIEPPSRNPISLQAVGSHKGFLERLKIDSRLEAL